MDLGRNDTNPIIFAQVFDKEIRIFDHYENNDHHICYHFDLIKNKVFKTVHIVLPQDAKAKRVDAEYSVEQQAKTIFGSSNVNILENRIYRTRGITTAKENV